MVNFCIWRATWVGRSTLDNIYILNETKSITTVTTCSMIMISARLLDFKFGNAELVQIFNRNKNVLFLQIRDTQQSRSQTGGWGEEGQGGLCLPDFHDVEREPKDKWTIYFISTPPFWSWVQPCAINHHCLFVDWHRVCILVCIVFSCTKDLENFAAA